jgi:hypothetical protein
MLSEGTHLTDTDRNMISVAAADAAVRPHAARVPHRHGWPAWQPQRQPAGQPHGDAPTTYRGSAVRDGLNAERIELAVLPDSPFDERRRGGVGSAAEGSAAVGVVPAARSDIALSATATTRPTGGGTPTGIVLAARAIRSALSCAVRQRGQPAR